MRLIIVSGLSGSGKTVALHVLEDLGYYCIDNLPATLIKAAIDEVASNADERVKLLAVGIDARNRREGLESLPTLTAELQQQDIQTELLFLQSTDDIILQRYSESRRRHPLAEHGTALRAAIEKERDELRNGLKQTELKKQLAEIMAKHTGQETETINRDSDRNFFMSPEEARDYGLIDAVIEKRA